jgi:hypothetical protein
MQRKVKQKIVGLGIKDHGAHRHFQLNVGGTRTVTIGALTLLAVTGSMDSGVAKMNKRVDVFVGNRPNGPAFTAIAAAWAALRNKFFTTKGGYAIATLAGVELYKGFVNEFHG